MFHLYTAPIGFLSSKRMLDTYLSGKIPREEDMNLELFLSQREYISHLPNQIHDNNRLENSYKKEDTLSDIFDKSIEQLSKLLYCDNEKIYVKTEHLSTWQEILINISPIPIIGWILNDKCLDTYFENNKNDMSLLPTIKNGFMDEDKFSFRELHIHINGTSESIHNWLHFLQNEGEVYEVIKASYAKVTMQYKQLGIDTVGMLTEVVLKAKYVREFLFDYIENTDIYELKLTREFEQKWMNYFSNNWINEIPHERIICYSNGYSDIYTLQSELKMWYELFDIINTRSYNKAQKNILYMLMHYYILSMSLFNRFLVQQSDQYGFSQFQLITDNELRDIYEDKGYKDRYKQLKGIYNVSEDLCHLELRFAPKDTVEKMTKLYERIIKDYNDLKGNITYSITTLAHFIKFPDSINKDGLPLSCRWANTRAKLEKQALALLSVIDSSYKEEVFIQLEDEIDVNNSSVDFFDSFVGIDAAGNELYARPEVFAPIFNHLNDEFQRRFQKSLNLTFHAGEDYVHLLSGIRYVWEAIYFLGMDKKHKWKLCRIGHATALGIEPKFWVDKLDGTIVMSKGEWLDNMIFAKNYMTVSRYDSEIENLWEEVYGSDYDNSDAWQAYKKRKENPYSCNNSIIQLYNSPNIVMKSNEMITLTMDKEDIEIMLGCQRKLLEFMKDSSIAIESMITSNVRISYYDKYEQHHIYRWLFPEGAEENIMPPVVLASDDPGLFNNNMRIEFSHLYEILRKKGKSENDIQDKVQELQENAKNFTFR